MKKIVIPIPSGQNSMIGISGIATVLEAANSFPGEHFEVITASAKRVKNQQIGRFSMKIDACLDEIEAVDLAIVPPLEGDYQAATANNQPIVEWLRHIHSSKQAELGSVCTGAYLLADTGHLDGKEASSHWAAMQELKMLYPDVIWRPEAVITDMDGMYTSGGTLSSFNLIIYLIEKFVNKTTAVHLSKIFEIDYHRNSQAPFMIFNNQKLHGDQMILQVQSFMEQHFRKNISVEVLAQRFGMSRRNLIRRFKIATGDPPNTYMQRLRIEEAKRLLEATNHKVGEAMAAVGYSDVNTFRTVFQRYTGLLPSQYKKRWG